MILHTHGREDGDIIHYSTVALIGAQAMAGGSPLGPLFSLGRWHSRYYSDRPCPFGVLSFRVVKIRTM